MKHAIANLFRRAADRIDGPSRGQPRTTQFPQIDHELADGLGRELPPLDTPRHALVEASGRAPPVLTDVVAVVDIGRPGSRLRWHEDKIR